MKKKLVSKSAFLTPRFLIFLFLCTAAAGSMLSAARLAFFHPEGLTNVTVSGSTGADGGYATLADAFAALNANPNQTGNVISVSIVGDTTEIGTGATLNTPIGGNWTSLTINPVGARTVTGAITAGNALVRVGASNVTINGLNTGGNSLTLSNTTVSAIVGTSTTLFVTGASNDTVTNCTILGSSTTAVDQAGGNVLFLTAPGNNNNTISGNNIGPAGTNLPTKGVMGVSFGTGSNFNTINNNNIFDFFSPTTSVAGISVQQASNNWFITNNRIYQTSPRTFSAADLTYNGILVSPGTAGAATITGNVIGFGAANGSGTTVIDGSTNRINGIAALSTSTTVATNIQGNIISGFNQTTSQGSTGNPSAFIGIRVGAIAGLFHIGDVTGNTIGSLDGSSGIVVNDTTTTANSWGFVGILDFSLQDGDIINNNSIGTVTINNGGTGTGAGFRGIHNEQTTGVSTTIDNNTIGGPVDGASAGTGTGGPIIDNVVGTYSMFGIGNAAANLTCTGNVIRNMRGNAQATGALNMSGIVITAVPTGVSTISQNTIHSLNDNAGTAEGTIYAIYGNFPNTANVVERNLVHSLSITSTDLNSLLAGIVPIAGSATYKNNMVRLGLDAAGNSITPGYSIFGMFELGGTNNFYFNSVYIGGSDVASLNPTFAFVSLLIDGTRIYEDNIFWNARSNASGTAGNFAIALEGLTGATSNYNDLFANGVGGCVGLSPGLTGCTLSDWQTGTGQDANSISVAPEYLDPNGDATAGDLHILGTSPCVGAGLTIAGITDDFDGDPRLDPPAIGADQPTPAPTPITVKNSLRESFGP